MYMTETDKRQTNEHTAISCKNNDELEHAIMEVFTNKC